MKEKQMQDKIKEKVKEGNNEPCDESEKKIGKKGLLM